MGRDQRGNYDPYGRNSRNMNDGYGAPRQNAPGRSRTNGAAPGYGRQGGGFYDEYEYRNAGMYQQGRGGNGRTDAEYEVPGRSGSSRGASEGYGISVRGSSGQNRGAGYGVPTRGGSGSRVSTGYTAPPRGSSGRNTSAGYQTAARTDSGRELDLVYSTSKQSSIFHDTKSSQRMQSSTVRDTGSSQRTQSSTVRDIKSSQRMQNRKAAARSTGQRKKRRRRKKRGAALFLCLLLVLLLLIGCGVGGWFLYQRSGGKSPVPNVTVSLDSLDSPYAILLDKETGTVLSSKSGDDMIYPASMAKIMTVLTAIDHIEKLDQTITMSHDYYNDLYAQDASRAGFEPGEEAVIRDLLYGALLPSGAECCMELSIQAAGSEAAFAELMNQKAAELGLTQTHFMNSTGLHHENQYSTPHEIGLILQAALRNKTFREVFTTHSYTVKPSNVHPDGFTFWSSMFKNMQAENVIGGEILGGKTGFTQAAGYCLASMAEVEEREYILVTAGWAANPRTGQYHINDAFLGYNALGRALAEQQEK